MSERSWQLAVGAQDDPFIEDLIGEITPLIQNENALLIDEPENRNLIEFDYDNQAAITARFNQLIRGRFFAELSDDLRSEAVKGFTVEGQWRYGVKPDDDDGLFAGESAADSVKSLPGDGLILSGLAGSELRGQSRDLDRLGDKIERNPLDKAVLLGGLGLIAAQQRWGRERLDGMAKYTRDVGDGIVDLTAIGATFHGDFQMHRRRLFRDNVRDPLGREQPFGPALKEAVLGAYHSVEPDILAAVLKHAVLADIDVKQLRQAVLEEWASRGPRPSFMGNYGDFGHDDGRLTAGSLRYWLEQPHEAERDVPLSNLVVWPGDSSVLFTSISRAGGLQVTWERASEKECLEEYDRHITIDNDELKDFIVGLFEQARVGAGRTGLPALKAVLDVVQ